jgi:hypothetical protein
MLNWIDLKHMKNLYNPNLNDPRVKARCQKALDWVNQYITSKPNWLSTREIDRHLGHCGRPLGKWLRQQLLVCEDDWYNHQTGICKKYVKNHLGYSELNQLLHYTPQAKVKITPEVEQQLSTGEFVYTEKSNRFWNPIQYIPTIVKRPLLAQHGFRHHYDIQCAAPTLIKQYALQLGMTASTPALDLYLANRTSVRQRIARECGISEKTVKIVINALFQGARLSRSSQSDLYHKLNGNISQIAWLQQDQFLCELKKDIKKCWDTIKLTLPVRTQTDKNGIERRTPLSSRAKSGVYLQLEKQVLTQVKKFLKKENNKGLLEHDGWSCERAIDPDELRTYVRTQTGYLIEIDWEQYED